MKEPMGWELMAKSGNLGLGLQMLWFNRRTGEWGRSLDTMENGKWIPIPPERVEAWKKRFNYVEP